MRPFEVVKLALYLVRTLILCRIAYPDQVTGRCPDIPQQLVFVSPFSSEEGRVFRL